MDLSGRWWMRNGLDEGGQRVGWAMMDDEWGGRGCERNGLGEGQVLDKLVKSRLHRLYVVDEHLKPIGIITLTDVLRTVIERVK